MYTLKAESRDPSSKGRQLRRNGIIPAVLYGRHLDESVLLQVSQRDTDLFLKTNSLGSRIELEIDGEKHQTMLKDLTKVPVTGTVEHLGFLALKKGEKVRSVASIVIVGREQVQRQGVVVLQPLNEIRYIALPSHLIDKIEVNIEHLEVNENIKLSDLDIANDPNIEILTALDSVVVTVTPIRVQVEETPETDEDLEETDEESAEETTEESEESEE